MPEFRIPSPTSVALPVRNALQALKVYVDARRGEVLNVTTTQRDALTPTVGLIVFNTTVSKHQGWDGAAWNNLY